MTFMILKCQNWLWHYDGACWLLASCWNAADAADAADAATACVKWKHASLFWERRSSNESAMIYFSFCYYFSAACTPARPHKHTHNTHHVTVRPLGCCDRQRKRISLYGKFILLLCVSLSTVSRCVWTLQRVAAPRQRQSLPHARLSGFLSFGLHPPVSLSPLHSSVLNALPLSTLESERSSLLWRRRGIWD